MKKLHDLSNKIIDTFTTPEISIKVLGQVEGFTVTTFFSTSRNAFIDKNSIGAGWKKMKTDTKLQYLYDNHNTDIPPIGYIRSAYLVEDGNFLGIYVKADIISDSVWQKLGTGEYKGFSGAFGRKTIMNDMNTNNQSSIEIILEKNSYSEKQLNEIKTSFPSGRRITINEVMRFSEIPSQVININFYLNLQYLLQTIQNHPIESSAISLGGMVLTSAVDAIVKDLYGFIKNGAKTLFSGKLIPKVVAKNTTLDKQIQIRIEAKNPQDMIEAVEVFNHTYNQLIKANKSKINHAKKILFERKNEKWSVTVET